MKQEILNLINDYLKTYKDRPTEDKYADGAYEALLELYSDIEKMDEEPVFCPKCGFEMNERI